MESEQQKIDAFLAAPAFAVVGASDDHSKWGTKVYKMYLDHDRVAYPVNPRLQEIDGQPVYRNLAALPERVQSVSIITPPPVTEKIVEEAIAAGVKHIWMQPGAESLAAVKRAEEAGINVIWGGPCVLVIMRSG